MHRTDKYSEGSSIIWRVWKHLHVVRSADLGKIFCNFGNNPMVLLILFDTFFKCPSNVNLLSNVKIKQKPIRVVTSYCRKNFKQIRHVSKGNFRCTLFTSLSTRIIFNITI